MKYRERVNVDKNRTLCDLELGWYSKDDMLKVLKWPLQLVRQQGCTLTQALSKLPTWRANPRHTLMTRPMTRKHERLPPRKKVEGAIRCCQQNPDTLVRTGGRPWQVFIH